MWPLNTWLSAIDQHWSKITAWSCIFAFTFECVCVCVANSSTSLTPAPQGVWSRLDSSPTPPNPHLPSSRPPKTQQTHSHAHVSAAVLIPLLCKTWYHRDSHQPTCQPPSDQPSSGYMQTHRGAQWGANTSKGPMAQTLSLLCGVSWIQNKCTHSRLV